jgi:hypothetical protein
MLSRYLKNTAVFSVITMVIFGVLLSCENPLSSSLGEKVDVAPPTITVETPTSGSYINGVTRFEGRATAYRELRDVEVKIFANDSLGQTLVDWTKAGIIVTGNNKKEKTWTFDLDTLLLNGGLNGIGRDGSVKIQFRAHDPNLTTATVELVYIVKNRPSDVRLTNPDNTNIDNVDFISNVITGDSIRGQITDRRGIKPGYPMIKLWPQYDPENEEKLFINGQEPADDDPNWGWVSMFLPGVDDPEQGSGFYADRTQIPVKRAAQIAFKMDKYTINPVTRQAVYEINPANGEHIPMDSGKYYFFKIKTRDTYFDSETQIPREAVPDEDPIRNEEELEGYFPSQDNDPFTARDKPIGIFLISSDIPPTVELDNTDIVGDEFRGPDGELKTPNIYISAVNSKKIAVNRENRPDFRLRVLTLHADSVSKAILQYSHSSSGRSGFLEWKNTGAGYVNNTNSATRAEEGYRGDPVPGSTGKIFIFEADGGLRDENGDLIFTTSPEPYTLTVTAYSISGNTPGVQSYTLYMDGDGPAVTIRSMRAYSDPPIATYRAQSGGSVFENPYTVNGNVWVTVDRSDDSGIKADERNTPLVKWYVEKVNPFTAENTINPDSLLSKIDAYYHNPSFAGHEFFDAITDTQYSGWVQTPVSTGEFEEQAHNFKFNTFRENPNDKSKNLWDKQDIWLYVIAEDGVQNLGFVLQTISIDDETDKPVINVPGLSDKNAAGKPITGPSDLDVTVKPDLSMEGNWAAANPRMNILEKDQGIYMNLTDDDGIVLDADNIKITLTDLNVQPNKTATLTTKQITDILANGSSKDWSGTLDQKTMANALLNSDQLKGGMYKIDITVRDDASAKVSINGTNPGDTPTAKNNSITFWFAVFDDLPQIIIDADNMEENSLQSDVPVPIYGRVRSYLKAQRLRITFEPDLFTPKWDRGEPISLDLYPNNKYNANEKIVSLAEIPKDADGKYTYYWRIDNVNFDPAGLVPLTNSRRFTLEVYDRLGNKNALERTVQVDKTPPDVNLLEFNYYRDNKNTDGEFIVNGKVPFILAATDDNGLWAGDVEKEDGSKTRLAGLKWWLLPASDTSGPTGWDYAVDQNAADKQDYQFLSAEEKNGGRFTGIIDTRKLTDKASYTLWAMAKDNAGNANPPIVIVTMYVDQSSDLPELNEGTLNPPLGSIKNAINLVISGTAEDDDGFNAEKVNQYVQIRFPRTWNTDGTAIDWDSWKNVPGTLNQTGAINFKFDFTAQGGGLGLQNTAVFGTYFVNDGKKYYQIRVTDEPVAGDNNRPAGKNPDFFKTYDPNDPGSPNPDFPDYVYTEAKEESKIFPTYTFTLDTKPPEVFFDHYDPKAGNPNHTPNRPTFKTGSQMIAILSGTVVEAEITTMRVTYGNTGGLLEFGSGYDFKPNTDGTYSWNINAYQNDFKALFDDLATAQGSQSITVEAVDAAGNVTRATWLFYKDTQGPEVRVESVGRIINHKNVPGLADFPANWPGDWPDGSDWKTDPTWNTLRTGNFNLENWSSEYAYITYADRQKIITSLTAENAVTPSVVFDVSDLSISGTFFDTLSYIWDESAGGKAIFQYRFDSGGRGDVTYNSWSGLTSIENPATGDRNNTARWKIPVPGNLADGEHTFDIRVYDMAANESVIYGLRFIVDRQVPNLPDDYRVWGTGLPNAALTNKIERVFSADGAANTSTVVFTLKGTVSDPNLSQLSALISTSGSNTPAKITVELPIAYWAGKPGVTWPPTLTDTSADKINGVDDTGIHRLRISANTATAYEWNWELDILEKDLKALRDGDGTLDSNTVERYITVTGTDRANRKIGQDAPWYFYLDTQAPELVFINLEKTSGSETTFANAGFADIVIQGTFKDTTKIRDVQFLITKWNYSTGVYEWYNGSAWVTTATPASTTWPSLLEAEYNAANAQTPKSWTLTSAILNAAKYKGSAANAYPNNLFNTEGKYKIQLRVTDWSLSSVAAKVGNPYEDTVREFYVDRRTVEIGWGTTQMYYNTAGLNFNINVRSVADSANPGFFANPNTITKIDGKLIDPSKNPDEPGYQIPGITVTATNTNAGTDSILGVRSYSVTVTGTMPANGVYVLELSAVNGARRRSSSGNTLRFTLDNEKPTISTTVPAGGNETIAGSMLIRGNANDNNRIQRVAYYVANSSTSFAAPTVPANIAAITADTNWRYDDGGARGSISGNGGAELMSIDSGTLSWVVNVDTYQVADDVDSKSLGSYTGTTYAQRYTAATAGTALTWNDAPLNTGSTANDNVYKMTVYYVTVDEAGNVNADTPLLSKVYWLYPEGNRPRVTILNPDPTTIQLVNGNINLMGIARDNEAVYRVWFRVLRPDGTPYTNLKVQKYNPKKWDDSVTETQTPKSLVVPYDRITGLPNTTPSNGWFYANGGGTPSVSWWATINQEGELGNELSGVNDIVIEVCAEDTTLLANGNLAEWDDPVNSNTNPTGKRGTISRASVANSRVVTNAPVFENQQVMLETTSHVGATPGWTDWTGLAQAHIRKRARYQVTVKHELGLSAIRWTTPTGATPSAASVNLLTGNYTSYTSDLAGINAATPTGVGIAVKAETKIAKITGTLTPIVGVRYLVLKADSGTTSGLALSPAENQALVIIKKSDTTPITLGDAELLQEDADGYFTWVVTVDLHTDILAGGAYKDESFRYRLNLRAVEVSKPSPIDVPLNTDLLLDNVPPRAVYTMNPRIAGVAATIGGEAGDNYNKAGTGTAAVGRVNKVMVWLSRNNNRISFKEKADGSDPAVPFTGNTVQVATFDKDGNATTITAPNILSVTEGAASGNDSFIVIDRNDPNGTTGHHGHKKPMGFGAGAKSMEIVWYANIDSMRLEDGRIKIHYLVYDLAGNTRYYETNLLVMNHAPQIKSIQLGTDIRGSTALQTSIGGTANHSSVSNGSIFTAIRTSVGAGSAENNRNGISEVITTDLSGMAKQVNFNVRNRLMALRVETTGTPDSNKSRSYRLEYVTKAAKITDLKNVRAGMVYIISEPGDTPWNALGAPNMQQYRRGLAFLAAVNGNDITGEIGTGVAWELNTGFYSTDGTLNNTYPSNLRVPDTIYGTGVGDISKQAEFAYKTGAFGTTAGTSIIDFTPRFADGEFKNSDLADFPIPLNQEKAAPWDISQDYSLFIVKVFDGDERDIYADFTLLALRVNNNDATQPYAQLYDINPKAEEKVTASNAVTALSAPGINENRTMGGIWVWDAAAAAANALKKSGHVEPRGAGSPQGGKTSLKSEEMGGEADAIGSDTNGNPTNAVNPTINVVETPWANPRSYMNYDTVSGKVILRGYAEDDQRIGSIVLRIGAGNLNNPTTITILDNNTTTAAATTNPPRSGILKIATNTNTANFTINGDSIPRVYFADTVDLDRHRVEWAYIWDTEAIPGGNNIISEDIKVQVIAYNANTTAAPGAKISIDPADDSDANSRSPIVQTVDSPFNTKFPVGLKKYNVIRMQIRPYVTGFMRDTRYNTERTSQGWYAFSRGETVVVTGFNLGRDADGNVTTIALPGVTDNAIRVTAATATSHNVPADTLRYAHYRQFTVENTAIASIDMKDSNNSAVPITPVRLTASTIEAVNTTRPKLNAAGTATDNNGRPWVQPWNTESSTGIQGSDLWDDYPCVHIWKSGTAATGSHTSATNFTEADMFRTRGMNWIIVDPSMSIDPLNGRLWESHSESGGGYNDSNGDAMNDYNNGTIKISTNRGGTDAIEGAVVGLNNPQNVAQFREPLINSNIYISSAGAANYTEAWTAFSIIGRSGTNQAWADLGGLYIHGPDGGNPALVNGLRAANTSHYLVEGTWYNASTNSDTYVIPATTDQFMNPHIVVTGNNIHVSYYDDKDKSIKYRLNTRGTPGTVNGTGANRTWVNLDGGIDADDNANTTGAPAYTGGTAYTYNTSTKTGTNITQWATGNTNTGYNNYLREVHVNAGDYVTTGQRLFTLGSRTPGTTTNTSVVTAAATGFISIGRTNNYNLREATFDGTYYTYRLAGNGTTIYTIYPVNTDRIVNSASRLTNPPNVGLHNAIALTSGGYPVIAYYDNTNQKLKLAVSGSATPTAAGNWTIIDPVITGPNQSGTGQYVSMRIDTTGGATQNIVHIAALNANTRKLIYVRGVLNQNTRALSNVTTQVVDNVGYVGKRCSISLDERGNPWIVYLNEQRKSAMDGAKVAFLNPHYNKVTEDMYGEKITGWETMHVPALFKVEDEKLGLENFPTRNVNAGAGWRDAVRWNAAIGYLAKDTGDDRYRIAYYVK